VVYDILFRATSETLLTIAADPKHLGAEIGFFAVLHSWGQNLLFHPHLHCVVPGGGLSSDDDRWGSCRPRFFLPVRVLSSFFRRLFLELLQKAFDAGQLHFFSALLQLHDPAAFAVYLDPFRKAKWVVYAKPPFAGPQQVLDYVGRYTHRVAISNNRLLDIEDGQVKFRYKDYRKPQPAEGDVPLAVAVIDTPPAITDAIRAVVATADLVLISTRPSLARTIFVLSAAPSRSSRPSRTPA
jgi:hypothetical protein